MQRFPYTGRSEAVQTSAAAADATAAAAAADRNTKQFSSFRNEISVFKTQACVSHAGSR